MEDQKLDVLWKIAISLMQKYCGWKVISTLDSTLIYTPDGSIINGFAKRESVIHYMVEQMHHAAYGTLVGADVCENVWNFVLYCFVNFIIFIM